MKCVSGKLSSLSLNVQRREDESSDLREKLADSKKQIQQVQREVSRSESFYELSKMRMMEAFTCLRYVSECVCVCLCADLLHA